MADYDDYRIADDDQIRAMNAGYVCKGEKTAQIDLPVYLTDEARKAARLCSDAAHGCEYLLDYARTSPEKRLLGYAAGTMKGISSLMGGGEGKESAEKFGALGVRRAMVRTFLLCNEAAITICGIAEASAGEKNVLSAARAALCSAQSVMALYLMQI